MNNDYDFFVLQYYKKHIDNGKWHTTEPTGKVPLKYWAVPLMVQGNSHDDTKSYNWHLRIMPSLAMVLEMVIVDFDPLTGDVVGTFTKARVVNNLDDMWSVATNPAEICYLRKMLKECGKLLANDESLFYKVIEDEPVPF